jgi:hypothetical protein
MYWCICACPKHENLCENASFWYVHVEPRHIITRINRHKNGKMHVDSFSDVIPKTSQPAAKSEGTKLGPESVNLAHL